VMREIRQPNSPRGQENELSKILSFMIAEIATRFENNVLSELEKEKAKTKFEDALPPGNYARMLVRLSSRVRRKIMRQFNNKRIDAVVDKVLGKVNNRQQKQFYKSVEQAIGIPTAQLIAKEGMTAQLNALKLETAQWVKKLRDETLEQFTNNTLHAMTTGASLGSIVEQFRSIKEKRKGHAEYLAQNQIQNFNSITGKIRAQKVGIKKAVWDTAGDESVRPSHADRDGKEFDLSKGLYSSIDGQHLIPGVDHRCRCTARYIIEEN